MIKFENLEAPKTNELQIYRELKKEKELLVKFLKLQKIIAGEKFRTICAGRKIDLGVIKNITEKIGMSPKQVEVEIMICKSRIKYLESIKDKYRVK